MCVCSSSSRVLADLLPVLPGRAWIQRRARRVLAYCLSESFAHSLETMNRQFAGDDPLAGCFQDFTLKFQRQGLADGRLQYCESSQRQHYGSIPWGRLKYFLGHAFSSQLPSHYKSLVIDCQFFVCDSFPIEMQIFFMQLKRAYPKLECILTDTRMFFLMLQWERDEPDMEFASVARQHFWIRLDPRFVHWSTWFYENRDYVTTALNWVFNRRHATSSVVLFMPLTSCSRTTMGHLSTLLQRLTYACNNENRSLRGHCPDQLIVRLDFRPLVNDEKWSCIGLILEHLRRQFNVKICNALPQINVWHASDEDLFEEPNTHHPEYYHWGRAVTLNKVDIRVASRSRDSHAWEPGSHRHCAVAFEWRFSDSNYASGLEPAPILWPF